MSVHFNSYDEKEYYLFLEACFDNGVIKNRDLITNFKKINDISNSISKSFEKDIKNNKSNLSKDEKDKLKQIMFCYIDKKNDKIIKLLKELIKTYKDNIDYKLLIIRFFIRNGNFEDVEKYSLDILKIDSNNVYAYLFLSINYLKKN